MTTMMLGVIKATGTTTVRLLTDATDVTAWTENGQIVTRTGNVTRMAVTILEGGWSF